MLLECCGKSFPSERELKKHKITHNKIYHEVTNEHVNEVLRRLDAYDAYVICEYFQAASAGVWPIMFNIKG